MVPGSRRIGPVSGAGIEACVSSPTPRPLTNRGLQLRPGPRREASPASSRTREPPGPRTASHGARSPRRGRWRSPDSGEVRRSPPIAEHGFTRPARSAFRRRRHRPSAAESSASPSPRTIARSGVSRIASRTASPGRRRATVELDHPTTSRPAFSAPPPRARPLARARRRRPTRSDRIRPARRRAGPTFLASSSVGRDDPRWRPASNGGGATDRERLRPGRGRRRSGRSGPPGSPWPRPRRAASASPARRRRPRRSGPRPRRPPPGGPARPGVTGLARPGGPWPGRSPAVVRLALGRSRFQPSASVLGRSARRSKIGPGRLRIGRDRRTARRGGGGVKGSRPHPATGRIKPTRASQDHAVARRIVIQPPTRTDRREVVDLGAPEASILSPIPGPRPRSRTRSRSSRENPLRIRPCGSGTGDAIIARCAARRAAIFALRRPGSASGATRPGRRGALRGGAPAPGLGWDKARHGGRGQDPGRAARPGEEQGDGHQVRPASSGRRAGSRPSSTATSRPPRRSR